MFEKHVATYVKHSKYLETLEWKKPGTSIYAIWYVRQYGTLMVFGDMGEATYQWHPEDSVCLQWMGKCAPGYFFGKCCASPYGRTPEVWDSQHAIDDSRNYFAEGEANEAWCDESRAERKKEEAAFEEAGGWQAFEDKHTWDEWLRNNGYDVFGDGWWESFPVTAGMRRASCVEAHLTGLEAAVAQLEQKGVLA